MRFHINPESGEPGPCRATVRCPFGGESEHYGSQSEARAAFEATQSTFASGPEAKDYMESPEEIQEPTEDASLALGLPSVGAAVPSWQNTEAYHENLAMALEIAETMALDPDHLPPIEDPAKSNTFFEEESYIDSLEAFKDPALAMGNCSIVADAVAAFYDYDEMEVIEEEVSGPYLNVHVANKFETEGGEEWVLDYTYSQIDPKAPWPYVAPLEEWQNAVQKAGYSPASEIKALYG